tara:strand:- start:142 stop:312 length:171 start_codon:yes stop_codon:yes gene_type:complete
MPPYGAGGFVHWQEQGAGNPGTEQGARVQFAGGNAARTAATAATAAALPHRSRVVL